MNFEPVDFDANDRFRDFLLRHKSTSLIGFTFVSSNSVIADNCAAFVNARDERNGFHRREGR